MVCPYNVRVKVRLDFILRLFDVNVNTWNIIITWEQLNGTLLKYNTFVCFFFFLSFESSCGGYTLQPDVYMVFFLCAATKRTRTIPFVEFCKVHRFCLFRLFSVLRVYACMSFHQVWLIKHNDRNAFANPHENFKKNWF